MRLSSVAASALLLSLSSTAWASGSESLRSALGRLGAKAPAKGAIVLAYRKTSTHDKQTKEVHGELRTSFAADADSLSLRWPQDLVRRANEEETARDRDARLGTPLRDAMKDLDPGRVSHLLDQAPILAGLIAEGTLLEEKDDAFEGRAAHRLVYSFPIRLSDFLRSRLIHSEGRLKVWVDADGLPLYSESVAQWNGKTSRFFGAFAGRTAVKTRYQVSGDRLMVRHRETTDWSSDDHQSSQVDKVIDLQPE